MKASGGEAVAATRIHKNRIRSERSGSEIMYTAIWYFHLAYIYKICDIFSFDSVGCKNNIDYMKVTHTHKHIRTYMYRCKHAHTHAYIRCIVYASICTHTHPNQYEYTLKMDASLQEKNDWLLKSVFLSFFRF